MAKFVLLKILIYFLQFKKIHSIEENSTFEISNNFGNFTKSVNKSHFIPKCCGKNEFLNEDLACISGNMEIGFEIESKIANFYGFQDLKREIIYDSLPKDCPYNQSVFSVSNCPGEKALFMPNPDGQGGFIYEHPFLIIMSSAWMENNEGCIDVLGNCTTFLYCRDFKRDEKIEIFSKNLEIIWSFFDIFLPFLALMNSLIIQRNITGHILSSYFISMFLCGLTAILNLHRTGFKPPGCTILDFVQIFFVLSSLFWISCLNFDLWLTFMKLKSKGLSQSSGIKRYMWYFSVSTLIPIILISTTLTIGQKFRKFGQRCIYYDESANYATQMPIVPLILLNFILFFHTALIIRGLKKDSKFARQNIQKSEKSFALFAKLFLMTGPNWIIRGIIILLIYENFYISIYGHLLEILFTCPSFIFFVMMLFHPAFIKWFKTISPNISERRFFIREGSDKTKSNISTTSKISEQEV